MGENTKYFAKAIIAYCARHNMPVTKLAAMAGLNQSTIARYTSGSRPDRSRLEAICNAPKDKREGVELLIGHLRDEVHRASIDQAHIDINHRDMPVPDLITILSKESELDPELRSLLEQLASVCMRNPKSDDLRQTK